MFIGLSYCLFFKLRPWSGFWGVLQGEEETMHFDFIKSEGKYITSNNIVKADIYLINFNVDKLLKIARVSRYEGIPFILDEADGSDQYQRLLIKNKLKNIAEEFVKNERTITFPNTVTLVLSNDCIEQNGRLNIPKNYSSIDIIDGQHRLFAYTQSNITDQVRSQSEILASAIKFRSATTKQITKNAAKVFCEINANQAKVKNNLIYLIKYDVLGDKDEIALAGKVLLECDKGTSALGGMLLTNSLRKKNTIDYPPVPITTIIDNDLAAFMKGLGTDGYQATDADFNRIFRNTQAHFVSHPAEFYKICKVILEQYFNIIKTVFNFDWMSGSNSYLISSKYFSAFIRLLRNCLYNQGLNIGDMKQVLVDLKAIVDAITNPINSASFPKGNVDIPSTKFGPNKIYEFLTDPANYNT